MLVSGADQMLVSSADQMLVRVAVAHSSQKAVLTHETLLLFFLGGSRPPKKQQQLSQQRLSQLKNRKGVRSQKDCGKCEKSLQEKVDRPLAIDKHCGTQPLSTKVHSEPTEAFVQAGTDNQVSSLGCT
jgi:hypothetical protein